MKILVVEDEPLIIHFMCQILDELRHYSKAVTSVDNALELLSRERFNLIFSDVYMPGRNGFELLGEVQKNYSHTPLVFVTGNFNNEMAVNARKMGAFDVISKPFKAADIQNVMARLK